MNSPVNVLWNNIIHTLENIDPSALKMHEKSTAEGLVSKVIAYDNGQDKIRTPFSNTSTREINIQETYLAHLWSFIYSIFVMHEEGIQKCMLNDKFDGTLRFETPLLKRAKLLFDWSISLADAHSDWDESLPNPKKHHSDEEKFYSEKVNNIFQSAVAFVLFHELTHLTQGHESYFLGAGASPLGAALASDRIQIENEADKFAFNMLIKQNAAEEERCVKGVSIILATSSALFIVPNAQGVKQKTHTDIDQRILNILLDLNLSTKNTQFYCWYLCSFIMNLFLQNHGIYAQINEYETVQDAFSAHLDTLDRIKESGGI